MRSRPADPAAYGGFEQGPVRPPSEAGSLLVRVTRGCPWNRCAFCPIYKDRHFSLRPVEHVLRDIDQVARALELIDRASECGADTLRQEILRVLDQGQGPEPRALAAALHWSQNGRRSIFLQDADAMAVRTGDLVRILEALRRCFPGPRRITTYARSHSLARRSPPELARLHEAGLNRIHVGLESGSDQVLERACKGASHERHVLAGRQARDAGFELSEYVMPGLGGRRLSAEHARETARALRRIEPDFVRLRSLAIPRGTPLEKELQEGRFQPLGDVETVREIRLLIQELGPARTVLTSDHALNLLPELEGRLPDDRDRLLAVTDRFLELDAEHRNLFRLGRRLGWLARLEDLEDPRRQRRVQDAAASLEAEGLDLERSLEDLKRGTL